ncbi:unnamed protein product [Adineta steineri]|uniref:Uncharacterized protein n=1 Tax=Adineta steineri TaxID=433720 RepID=A0A819KB27_9BILA|nr:unnamed protein product [Adineta steineri]
MDPKDFINALHNCEWDEKVLLLLRIKSTDCLKVDIGLRDATINKKDYELWRKREEKLTKLRSKSSACLECDTRLKNRSTDDKDIQFWGEKINRSSSEIDLINLMIKYINENTSSPMDPKVFMKLFTQCKWNRLNIRLKMFKKQLADEEKLLKGV